MLRFSKRCGQPWRTILVLWFVVFAVYGYIHQKRFGNAMAISRQDLLYAIVFKGTFAIDDYAGNTLDKAFARGHYYSDKAPGTTLLALPGFYLSSKVVPALGVSMDSQPGRLFSSWICVTLSVAWIAACGMVCLFLWLQQFVPGRHALLAV